MKGNFRKGMALLLAASMAFSSVSYGNLMVFAEEETLETAAETDTSSSQQTKETTVSQTDPETQESQAEETSQSETKDSETNPDSTTEESTDETKSSEETPAETENSSQVETEGETKLQESEKISEINEQTESTAEADKDAPKTGKLLISLNDGGKVIIRDKSNNVMKELTAADVVSGPYEIVQEIGTEVTVEMVSESEKFSVAQYRLMTDRGKVIENKKYEEGISNKKESFTFVEEDRAMVISFTGVKEEEVDEVGTVRLSMGDGGQSMTVECDGNIFEIVPEMFDEEFIEAAFPVGKDITISAVPEEGYDLEVLSVSNGTTAEGNTVTFQLQNADEIIDVIASFKEKDEKDIGKMIASKGPGTTYIRKGSEDGDVISTLKDGETWTAEDSNSDEIYYVEMYPDDLSIPYSITQYRDTEKVMTRSDLWIQLNPGEGVRSYFYEVAFDDTDAAEKFVCDFKSIEGLSGIPTASGNNHESTDPDYKNLPARAKLTVDKSIWDAEEGDVFDCAGVVTSHMYAHNYFSSQVPMRVQLNGGAKKKNKFWNAFGGTTFSFWACASTTSECCPYFGNPGTVYFIVTKVTANKVSGKLFFKNKYRNTVHNGYRWQSAEGKASFNKSSIILKKALYVRSEAGALQELMEYDQNDYYNKKATFEIYKANKTTLVDTVETSDNGLTDPISLGKGTYYIKETHYPGGAEKTQGWWKLVINANGKASSFAYEGSTPLSDYNTIQKTGSNQVVKLVNQAYYAHIIVRKHDDKGKWDDKLKGAEFALYKSKADADANRDPIKTLTVSQENTTFDIDLPIGNTFWVKETKAPSGFKQDTLAHMVVTAPSAAAGKHALTDPINYVSIISNTPDTEIELQVSKKFRDGTGAPAWKNLQMYSVEGAAFEFYYDAAAKKPIGTVFVKANGSSNKARAAMTTEVGSTIYVREVSAPDSGAYQLDSTIYPVTVRKVNDKLYEAVYEATDPARYVDLTGAIKKTFTKQTGLSLAGAVFSIAYKQAAQGPASSSYTYTWQFKTDANGDLMFNAGGYVSGPMDAILVSGGKYLFPVGFYDITEVTPPAGAIKSDEVYHFVATDNKGNSASVPYNVLNPDYSISEGKTQNVPNIPNTGYVKLVKTSSNTAISAGNNMYSLAGAVFELTNTTNGNIKYTLTTDANGNTSTIEIGAGTYAVREVTAPKGFKAVTNIPNVTVVRDQTSTISVADEPIVGTTDVTIRKQAAGATSKSMAGAQFKVEYFDNTDCSGTPLRTWVFATRHEVGASYGLAKFNDQYIVSGDAMYANNILPLGSIRVTEIKAPVGFDIDPSAMRTGTILQNGDSASVTFDGKYNAPFSLSDQAFFGGVKINKDCIDRGSKPSGDATLEGAVFAVFNNNDYSVYRPDKPDVAIAKGEEICRMTTNANGDAQSPRVMIDFTPTNVIQCDGNYIIREINPSTGYLLPDGYQKEFYLPNAENTIIDLTGEPVIEPVIRGGIKINKQDSELKRDAAPQGDASLQGAEFTITNKSVNPVVVNGQEYAVDAVVMTLTTDENGYAETGEKVLPYGTYEVRETKVPEGYLLNNYVDTIQIRTDGEYPYAKSYQEAVDGNEQHWYEDVIRFDIELTKFKDTLTSEDPDDRVECIPGIDFSIQNVSEHSVLVGGKEYQPGETVMTITTDENGVATTNQDGAVRGALPYGHYLIHEVNCPEELVPVKDFTVDGTATGNVYDGKTYKGIYLNNVPIESRIRIRKVDVETKETIPQGATFQILDKDKNVMRFRVTYPALKYITEFTTNGDGIIETPTKLPYGTYYLHEVDPPYDRENLSNGYVLDEDLEFTVSENNAWEDAIEVTYEDFPTRGTLEIKKADADTKQALAGAVYAVFADADIVTGDGTVHYKKGDLADTVTIGEDGTGITEQLYLGSYHLQEIKAPRGYCLDETVYPFTMKYDPDQKDAFVLVNVREETLLNKPTTLKLYKDDIDGLALDGITFQLERVKDIQDSGIPNSLAVDGGTYVTSGGGHIEVKYLVSGVYSLTEVETLPGYVLDSTPRYVTVDENGYIFASDADGNSLDADGAKSDTVSLDWENDYTKWDFSKTDVTGDGELEGAKLEIHDSDGKLVYSWTSGKELHRINKIPLGKYTLVEKTAPKGYVIAREVLFEVTNTGVVQKAAMVDKVVSAHKVDETGNGAGGAKLEVYLAGDTDGSLGRMVDSWTADGQKHDIDGLEEGFDYVLVEAEAPEGWVKANPVPFSVTFEKENQEVSMVDIRVKAHKYDETAESYVEGAKLEVRDADGTAIDSWTTGKEAHYISGLAAGKSYTLIETEAPDGFAKSLPVKFTVEDNGRDQEVTMVNKKVLVSKVDTSVKELAGAKLHVEDEQGNTVDSWVSDGKPHDINGLEVGKTYTLVEDEAPEGYAIASPIPFTVADNAKNDEFNLINKQVFVHKTDVTGEKEIPGAKIKVLDLQGNVVDEWISEEEAHPISNIRVNETYVLHEEVAPEGYVIASDIEFTVYDDFKVQHVSMKDKQVFMSKVDVTGEKEIPGATIVVYDKDGKEMDKWESGEEPHPISSLKAGETYTLHEEVAAEGYVIANDVGFTVLDDFKVQKVSMTDKQVFMSKVDVTGEKEIPGATIVVYDKDGKKADRWVSGETPHPIRNLKAGETYTLHEEVAADGYVTASDIVFSVEDDFADQKVSMTDKQVFVSKKSVTGGEELPGAKLTVTEAGTGKVVDTWVSEEKPHAVNGLTVGGHYILTEETAPEGYVIAEAIAFEVPEDGKIQTVEMKDKQVTMSKVDVAGEEVPGATITVTNENGDVVDEWVFGETPHNISGLEVGKTYTLTETQAPDGYVIAESITFTVENDFTVQHVEMVDKQVLVSKTDITGGEEIEGAHLTVTDEDGRTVDEWDSTTDGPHPVSGLEVGKTYTLTETQAPDGYVTAESITFTVEDDFQIQTVEMQDDYTKVEISKQDITTKKELPGAKLEVRNEDGDVVEAWTSTNEPHYIEKLPVGDYTLTEVTAPDGYEVAETVKFTVEDTGEIQHVEMFDSPKPAPAAPKTGDGFPVGSAAATVITVLLLGAAGILLLRKKRRE